MKKFLIVLLTVLVVVSLTFAGCNSTTSEPPGGEEEPPPGDVEPPPEDVEPPPEEEPSPEPPRPGDWTITSWTGSRDVMVLTFTVDPHGTLITGYSYQYPGFWISDAYGDFYTDYGSTSTHGFGAPITDSQFADEVQVPRENETYWDLVFQGEFNETGTNASGTWEVSLEGTPYAEGTWEASAP